MQGRLTLSAANTATELTLSTPIIRVGADRSGEATIMELIKVWVNIPAVDLDAAAATARNRQFSMSTTSSGATPAVVDLDNPRGLCFLDHGVRNAFTAAGTGIIDYNDVQEWDFTDGAGHGILVASDNIFIQANTAGWTAAAAFTFKLSYRFKRVSLIEYIGIVQSQQ